MIELRAAATLAISPFLVLFAVFFWSFLWRIPGAFIGVPATIAMLTMCAQYAGSAGSRCCSQIRQAGNSPVAPFYFTMSCSLMTDRLSVHGDPVRRKHSHAPVRAVRKCLYVEIGGKVVGRAHHLR